MLKVIKDCFGFALLRPVIGPKNSRHFLHQSDAKLKPITTRPPAFSRALECLDVFILSCHRLLEVFSFLPCDNLGFDCMTLGRKELYTHNWSLT